MLTWELCLVWIFKKKDFLQCTILTGLLNWGKPAVRLNLMWSAAFGKNSSIMMHDVDQRVLICLVPCRIAEWHRDCYLRQGRTQYSWDPFLPEDFMNFIQLDFLFGWSSLGSQGPSKGQVVLIHSPLLMEASGLNHLAIDVCLTNLVRYNSEKANPW